MPKMRQYPFDSITAEDLKSGEKIHPAGVLMSKPQYIFNVSMSQDNISSHINSSEGLSILNAATPELRRVMLSAQRVRLIERVGSNVTLELTVAEPYVPVIYRNLRQIDSVMFLRPDIENGDVEITDETTDNASTENVS